MLTVMLKVVKLWIVIYLVGSMIAPAASNSCPKGQKPIIKSSGETVCGKCKAIEFYYSTTASCISCPDGLTNCQDNTYNTCHHRTCTSTDPPTPDPQDNEQTTSKQESIHQSCWIDKFIIVLTVIYACVMGLPF